MRIWLGGDIVKLIIGEIRRNIKEKGKIKSENI